MTGRAISAGAAAALFFCAAAGAAAIEPASPSAPRSSEDQSVQQLMRNCDAHKFETIVTALVDGQPHQSKVRLCGKDGQSDAEWIGTLKDAIAKLNADKSMATAVRTQIVTAIKSEIARLEIGQAGTLKQQTASVLPPPRPRPPVAERLADEYSSLPPLPATPPPPPHVIGPGALPMSATSAERTAIALPLAAGPPPKLSFACYSPGDVGGDSPCAEFAPDTMLTISAAEDIGRGMHLRFARNGEQRAEIDLPQLRRGSSLRVALPREVCAGVSDGRLNLELVKDGELVKSDGPYSLRC